MEGIVISLINVYALTLGLEWLHFYQQASTFLGFSDPCECLILGEDFNTTLEEQDHLGTEQCPAAMDVLQETVNRHSLVDVWCDHHLDDVSMFTFIQVEAHCSPEDPSLCGACQEKWEEPSRTIGPRGAFVQSRIHLLWEIYRGSRFFYALEKKSGAKKYITCLLIEDSTPLTDPAEMCGRTRAFHAGLFSLDPTNPDACRVLWNGLLTVSVGNQDRLELPLTLAEFLEALRHMPTNKSPGMDGLTVEFYHMFWDFLNLDLVTVWAKSSESGVLPLSCRQAVLALLPKKGDPRDLWNWRPVLLLSTDYKVIAKAILLRLGSVVADVVHTDQTYTIPGHTIFDNLYLVRDLLELGCRDGLSFTLLSLNQEKAFDRVDHG
ncbi:unnamed protein product [Caretta caretta]